MSILVTEFRLSGLGQASLHTEPSHQASLADCFCSQYQELVFLDLGNRELIRLRLGRSQQNKVPKVFCDLGIIILLSLKAKSQYGHRNGKPSFLKRRFQNRVD